MVAEVIVDISNSEVDKIFDYFIDGSPITEAGFRVLVPFGNMTVEGYVIGIKEKSDYDSSKIKTIIKVLDKYPAITNEMLELMRYMKERYHLKTVDVLRLFIPSHMRGGQVKELTIHHAKIAHNYENVDVEQIIKSTAFAQREVFEYLKTVKTEQVSELNKKFSASALRNLIARGIVETYEIENLRTPFSSISNDNNKIVVLTPAQNEVVKNISSSQNTSFLLHGVTGSGKTEVYMNCISKVLSEGKTAIMLVPEISLTPQVLRVFRGRFGENVALLHSGLSPGERFDEWRRLRDGRAKVAIGARSAIFAPLQNVGLIVIDEEHDNSYVSESNPRYSTHEVATFRAKQNNCPIVLGSATPSIESYHKARMGEYKLLELPERVNKKALPEMEIVNMCKEVYDGNNGIFSRKFLINK